MKTYQQFAESLKDYTDQGKNKRVPGEDTASFGKLFKDDLKQQLRQFATFRGGITRTMNPFLGKGQGALSGPTPLARQTPRLIRQGAKSLVKRILSRGRLG